MRDIIEIECPPELLIGLHLDAERFAELVKIQAAIRAAGQAMRDEGIYFDTGLIEGLAIFSDE